MAITATVPTYLVGRNLSLFTVTPVLSDAAGGLTAGSAISLKTLGVFDSFEADLELETEEIHSGDAIVGNEAPKWDKFTITVTEVVPATGNSNLFAAYAANLYFRIACQNTAPAYGTGSGVAGLQFVAIGIRKSCKWGVVEGKNAAQLTLAQCGIPVFYGSGVSPI